MKNRKLLYFLIPLVVLIWGRIFWSFMPVNSDNKSGNTSLPLSMLDSSSDKFSKRYSISDYDRDPFTNVQRKMDVNKKTFTKSSTRSTPHPNLNYKLGNFNYTYLGYVLDKHNKIVNAILRRGVQELTRGINDTIDGCKVRTVGKDSILVEYKKELYLIKRTY